MTTLSFSLHFYLLLFHLNLLNINSTRRLLHVPRCSLFILLSNNKPNKSLFISSFFATSVKFRRVTVANFPLQSFRINLMQRFYPSQFNHSLNVIKQRPATSTIRLRVVTPTEQKVWFKPLSCTSITHTSRTGKKLLFEWKVTTSWSRLCLASSVDSNRTLCST